MRPITADLHMAQLMPLPLHSLSLASVKSGLVLPFYMVCLSVCVLGTPVNCVIMAEPIAMPFGGHTEVGPWNHALDGGPDPPKEGVLLRGHVLDTSWTVNKYAPAENNQYHSAGMSRSSDVSCCDHYCGHLFQIIPNV